LILDYLTSLFFAVFRQMLMISLVTTALTVIVLTDYATATYTQHKGLNCYEDHGAKEIDTYPIGTMSLAHCEAKCDETPSCTAVTFGTKQHRRRKSSVSINHGEAGTCFRRKDVKLSECAAQSPSYDTWVKDPTPGPSPPPPPTPPSPGPPTNLFPGTDPAFIKAFVEGLVSDNGTDAKACEHDTAAFASSMVNLGKTAVEEVKAVSAVVEKAKETCTPVAEDAKKFVGCTLGDFFHPLRIGKNYQAKRTDILTEIGLALEALANKDFKGAGNNVGKFNRRLIEGPQTELPQSLPMKDDMQESDVIGTVVLYVATYWGFATQTQGSLATETPDDWGSFLEGLLEGLMSDGTDFSDCAATIPVVGQTLEVAKKKVGEALAATMTAAKIAKQSCGKVAGDVAKLAAAAFYDLKHPDEVLQNFQDAQYDILTDLGQAFISMAHNDNTAAGTEMGMAFHRIIEGEPAKTVLV
jgi:hypothetical protein